MGERDKYREKETQRGGEGGRGRGREREKGGPRLWPKRGKRECLHSEPFGYQICDAGER